MITYVVRQLRRSHDIGYIKGNLSDLLLHRHPKMTKVFVWFPSKDHPANLRSVNIDLLRGATDMEIEMLRVECLTRGVDIDDLTNPKPKDRAMA